jgi:hypothetical protein
MDKRLLFIIGIIILSINVSALGITPGRSTFDFTSGAEQTVEFSVINSEAQDLNLVVVINGELNKSIGISENSFHMNSNEKEKKLTYVLKMPDELSPGLHTSEIIVLQLPGKSETSEAFMGAAIGVTTQIYVNVPYPGKYIDAGFDAIGDGSEGITFVLPVVSRGELDIGKVRASIDIYTALNEKIASVNTNEISLASKKREELVAKWDSVKSPSGKYFAVATIIYDEETTRLEKEFTIGNRELELLQVEANNFQLGEIAKFEMLVENKWGEEIKGAYAQMNIFNKGGQVMADFKSATYDIPALSKKILVAFWDSVGVSKGNYDASVFLNYGKESKRKDFKLEVLDNKINVVGLGYVIKSAESNGEGMSSMTIVLITIIGVLVLINLIWFLVLRKKLKRE